MPVTLWAGALYVAVPLSVVCATYVVVESRVSGIGIGAIAILDIIAFVV